jgi:hypothetical protein
VKKGTNFIEEEKTMRNTYENLPDEVVRRFSRCDPHNLEHLKVEGGHVTLYVRSRTAQTLRAARELAQVFPGHTFAALPAAWYHADVPAPPWVASPAGGLGITGDALQEALRQRGFTFKKPVADGLGKGCLSVTGYCPELAADVCLAGSKPLVHRIQFGLVLDGQDGQPGITALLDLLRLIVPGWEGCAKTGEAWVLVRLDSLNGRGGGEWSGGGRQAALAIGHVRLNLEVSPRPGGARVVSLQIEEATASKGAAPPGGEKAGGAEKTTASGAMALAATAPGPAVAAKTPDRSATFRLPPLSFIAESAAWHLIGAN